MHNKYFGNPNEFCIVTGKEYALSCLQEAYRHGYKFFDKETAELCPYDAFFSEYPETPEKPELITFRFWYNHALDKFLIGWGDDVYYKTCCPSMPIYHWPDVLNELAPENPDFLDLL